MPDSAQPRRHARWLIVGLGVWTLVSAVVFALFRDEWFRTMADKAGFLNLPPVTTLLRPALGLTGFAHMVLGAVLVATHRLWWRRGEGQVRLQIALAEPPVRAGVLWWLALALVLAGALAERLPRMTQSFWGDESLCLNSYVIGRFKPRDADDHQGAMKYVATSWTATVFSDDGGGNNHFLYSILSRSLLEFWRAKTHQPKGAFTEPLLRVWPLIFGLASLAALAGLMRRIGLPWGGILAAALLALHPWHLRFSTEARGYALMIFFFILTLWSWVNALERGRWRDWAAVAACQFFALWSWKGVMYPLFAINVVAPGSIWLARGEGSRLVALGRWLVCNVIAAAAFIPLVAAAQIQMIQMLPRIAKMGNLPMDWPWLKNLVSETIVGCQAWQLDVTNPEEIFLHRWAAMHPVMVPAALVVVAVALAAGFIQLTRKSRVFAAFMVAIPVGGMVAAVHFKLGLHIELLRWYWFFLTPVIALLAAAGAALAGRRRVLRVAASAVVLAAVVVISWPMCVRLTSHATEDLRGALEIARSTGYRPFEDVTSSKVMTIWLWRHPRVYDPRGSTKAESVEQLQGYMRTADAAGLDFYLISGYPTLTELLHPEVMPVLENPAFFEKKHTFWAQLPQNTLKVFRYRSGSLAAHGGEVATRQP
ncbi:MAG: glycosyltransferase family 39 protein [Verrucomicrobiaceae bacterium]|nr:glycosyltransferase family 39 protein [Verrucomicrobiaceae bacterium]